MADPARPAVPITPDLLISQLLRAYPEARPILARHGLCTCGGAFGPSETIRFFARVQGVEPSRLVQELKWAVDHPVPIGESPSERTCPRPDHWYFPLGVLLACTAFGAWSAWLFWSLSRPGPGDMSPVAVQLHAHAQLSGWLLLFVMGLTSLFLPRLWRTSLAAPRLARILFLSMILGLGLGLMGELGSVFLGMPDSLMRLGRALQWTTFVVFVLQMVWTFRASRRDVEPFSAFVLAGLFWLALIQGLELGHAWGMGRAADGRTLLFGLRIHSALHVLQLQGCALLIVVGLCLRLLPALYGLRPIEARRAWWGLDFIATGLVGELLLLLAFYRTAHRPFGTCLPFTWAMLATGVGLVTFRWFRGQQDPAERGPHTWMIRVALGWLVVAFSLLVPPALTLFREQVPWSIELQASTHALGLGFVLSVLMGLTARLVPLLEGRSLERDRFLAVAFGLACLACGSTILAMSLPQPEVQGSWIWALSATIATTSLGIWSARMFSIRSWREVPSAADHSCGCQVEPETRTHRLPKIIGSPRRSIHDTQGSSILMLPG